MKLKIGNMVINFSYHFEDYFHHGLASYQVDDSTNEDASIRVFLSDEITVPSGTPYESKLGKFFYKTDTHQYLVVHTNNGIPFQLIKNNLEYTEVEINLHRYLVKRLAEQEYILSSIQFLDIASRHGYLGIHASSLEFHGKAIVFSAPSQTGKSTLARRWKELFPESIYINDDKPLLYSLKDTIMVQGSPFAGGSALHTNTTSPLGMIIFIEQGPLNQLTRLSHDESLPFIMRNIFRPNDEKVWNKVIPIIQLIIEKVPIYRYQAKNELSSVHDLYTSLQKEQLL